MKTSSLTVEAACDSRTSTSIHRDRCPTDPARAAESHSLVTFCCEKLETVSKFERSNIYSDTTNCSLFLLPTEISVTFRSYMLIRP